MARARRPHRNLTAPLGAGTQWRTRRAEKFAAKRPRGGPLAGPGKFFRSAGLRAGAAGSSASRASRDGHAQRRPEKEAMAGHISGTRMQDGRPPAGPWASITRVCRAPGHVLQDAFYRNGHARSGFAGHRAGQRRSSEGAKDRTGNCRRGRAVSSPRTGSAHSDDGAQGRRVTVNRSPGYKRRAPVIVAVDIAGGPFHARRSRDGGPSDCPATGARLRK